MSEKSNISSGDDERVDPGAITTDGIPDGAIVNGPDGLPQVAEPKKEKGKRLNLGEAAKNKAEADEASKRAVEQIDMTKAFAVLFHQTEARNHFVTIAAQEGDTVADLMVRAETEAAETALKTGRMVAVFGPQVAVKKTPEKPVADSLQLSFG